MRKRMRTRMWVQTPQTPWDCTLTRCAAQTVGGTRICTAVRIRIRTRTCTHRMSSPTNRPARSMARGCPALRRSNRRRHALRLRRRRHRRWRRLMCRSAKPKPLRRTEERRCRCRYRWTRICMTTRGSASASPNACYTQPALALAVAATMATAKSVTNRTQRTVPIAMPLRRSQLSQPMSCRALNRTVTLTGTGCVVRTTCCPAWTVSCKRPNRMPRRTRNHTLPDCHAL